LAVGEGSAAPRVRVKSKAAIGAAPTVLRGVPRSYVNARHDACAARGFGSPIHNVVVLFGHDLAESAQRLFQPL